MLGDIGRGIIRQQPNGRTVNPAANAANAKMNPVVSLTPLKNCAEMIVASSP